MWDGSDYFPMFVDMVYISLNINDGAVLRLFRFEVKGLYEDIFLKL